MDLKIFDVEHGACALLTCDNNTRIMIDGGHNASTGWYPGTYLRQQGITQIEMLAVTNYDEDHVSGIADLFARVNVLSLLRNKTVSAQTLHQLKSEDGMGSGINFLAEKINIYPGSPIDNTVSFQGLTYQCFSNPYPMFEDENNLSLVLYLRCNGVGVLFPRDLETDGWATLLTQPDFRQVLGRTGVLIASHHGRENGWYDELRNSGGSAAHFTS
jgi:beta-lactamase superfamily II metal-dependent hydrolase